MATVLFQTLHDLSMASILIESRLLVVKYTQLAKVSKPLT
jgi:hypothetical protein